MHSQAFIRIVAICGSWLGIDFAFEKPEQTRLTWNGSVPIAYCIGGAGKLDERFGIQGEGCWLLDVEDCREWDLGFINGGNDVPSAMFESLCVEIAARNIEGLRLPLYGPPTGRDIQLLAQCTQLRRLWLSASARWREPEWRLPSADLLPLSSLGRLEGLRLEYFDELGDDDCEALIRSFSGLRTLSLVGCVRTGLLTSRAISRLSDLEALDLEECSGLTLECLSVLSRVSTLRSLNLRHCSGIKGRLGGVLARFSSLECIRLGPNLSVDDSDLMTLIKKGRLKKLEMDRLVDITPDFLAALGEMKGLEELRILSCTGIEEGDFVVLSQLKTLRELDLRGSVNAKGGIINILRERLPACKIRVM